MSEGNVRSSRRRFLTAVPAAVTGAVASKGGRESGHPANHRAGNRRYGQGSRSPRRRHVHPRGSGGGGSRANANLNNYTPPPLNIPQDTEPAYMFKPSLPGKEPKGPATPGAAIKYTRPPQTLKRPANSRMLRSGRSPDWPPSSSASW